MPAPKNSNKSPKPQSQPPPAKKADIDNNQKKLINLDNVKTHRTAFSESIYKESPYMRTFIKEVKDPESERKSGKKASQNKDKDGSKQCKEDFMFHCRYCDAVLLVNSLNPHIKSPKHKTNTPKEEYEKLEELIKLLTPKTNPNSEADLETEEKKEYLAFLAFCMTERLSFSQISRIGKYLQQKSEENRLSFFDGYFFDLEEIAKIARDAFGKCLHEELENTLRTTPFSFCVDTCTVAGESVLATKVRYVEKIDGKYQIQNKISDLTTLEDSSTGKTIAEILKTKLFVDQQIKDNFLGMAHDHASSLSGINKGLGHELKEIKDHFLDVKDPCHSLSLTIKNAMKKLPPELKNFIKSIHKHFKNAPQRKSKLLKLQTSTANPSHLATDTSHTSHPPHLLQQYIRVRWLSLGDSLERLLELWNPLIEYMRSPPREADATMLEVENGSDNEDEDEDEDDDEDDDFLGSSPGPKLSLEEFSCHLNDPFFKIQIQFLHYIIHRLNSYNKRLQNPNLNPAQLKTEIITCYEEMLALIVEPEFIRKTQQIARLNTKWSNSKYIFKTSPFIDHIANHIDGFRNISDLNKEQKEEFSKRFREFLKQIVYSLQHYLPFKNDVLNTLDFIELVDGPEISLKDKIIYFNKYFNLIPMDCKDDFDDELVKFPQKALQYLLQKANDIHNNLTFEDIWNMLEKNDNFKHIASLARAAKGISTSSVPIEQSFSILRLIKTNQRNQLSQETLQSLMMVHDHFSNREIVISAKMVEQFDQVKSELNGRKSRKRVYNRISGKQTKEKPKKQVKKVVVSSKGVGPTRSGQASTSTAPRQPQKDLVDETQDEKDNSFKK